MKREAPALGGSEGAAWAWGGPLDYPVGPELLMCTECLNLTLKPQDRAWQGVSLAISCLPFRCVTLACLSPKGESLESRDLLAAGPMRG